MKMMIKPGGVITTVYSEQIDLRALGMPAIRRASHVEPDERGEWTTDLAPVGGPCLGPFPTRSVALRAEDEWLSDHLGDLPAKGVSHV
jgi:hypothetical protein